MNAFVHLILYVVSIHYIRMYMQHNCFHMIVIMITDIIQNLYVFVIFLSIQVCSYEEIITLNKMCNANLHTYVCLNVYENNKKL